MVFPQVFTCFPLEFLPEECQYIDVVCTLCQNKTKVTNSRAFRQGIEVWRRRECTACGHVFTTYERYNYRDVQVVKRSELTEPFSRDKLLLSIAHACNNTSSDALELTKTVMQKLDFNQKAMQSTTIAAIVNETLTAFSPAIQARYNSYQLEK